MNKNTWPKDVDIKHGENEIQQLDRKLLLNTYICPSSWNEVFNSYKHNEWTNKKIKYPYKTLPISTAECERGFSLMNIIYLDLRFKLTIKNISI